MRQLKITKQVTNRETASLDKYLQEIGKVELITADDFDVIEHPRPAEISERYKATRAADGEEKRREFVMLLATVAVPIEVGMKGDFFVATWWQPDVADGLDRARQAAAAG